MHRLILRAPSFPHCALLHPTALSALLRCSAPGL